MGIWLREAMTIEPFNRAKLIAGKDGIDRMVVATNIQEVPDVDKWLGGGEMLFSSGYAFGGEKDTIKLMERLYDRGLTALVIKPGQYMRDIPDYMIRKADELHLPLFRIPSDLPYMDCILPIMLRITDEHYSAVERTERIHNQLLQVMIGEGGLNGITEVLHQVVGYPVMIFSTRGSLLTYVAEENSDTNIESLFQALLFAHRRRMMMNKCNIVELADGNKRVCIPVVSQNELLVYLLIDCHLDSIYNTDLFAVENASTIIAVTILQQRAYLEREKSAYSQLLWDILNRKYSDKQVIYQRLDHIGFDFSEGLVLCQIGADNFEAFIRENEGRIDEAQIQNIKENIQSLITEHFRNDTRASLCMKDGVGMVIMFSIRDDQDIKRCRIRVGEILGSLEKEYEKIRFSAGIGSVVRGVQSAEKSWKEAKLAKKIGKNLNRQSTQRITLFSELGCLSFLYESTHSLELLKFYHGYMNALTEYDNENNTDLVHTLEIYFENNKNIRRTADELFVHKNSVIYRLHKIESIIGEKLEDSETSFNLQMCMKIREML